MLTVEDTQNIASRVIQHFIILLSTKFWGKKNPQKNVFQLSSLIIRNMNEFIR